MGADREQRMDDSVALRGCWLDAAAAAVAPLHLVLPAGPCCAACEPSVL